MTELFTIEISNGTKSITVGDSTSDFKLLSHSGFDSADYDVQLSEGGASDGGYISTARLSSRTLEIAWDFSGKNAEEIRQSLISFFAPQKELTITAKRGKIIRYITGVPSEFEISEKNRYTRSNVNLSVICPDPFFKAEDSVYQSATIKTAKFHLPCHLPCIIGTQTSTGDINLTNNGDTYADMIVDIAAASTVTAPYILNRTNGKKIKITDQMTAGSVLRISTVRRNKNATIIGGARCHIDPTSQFSDFLEKGLNQLTYSSNEGSDNLAANVKYTALFYGI